MIFKNKKTVIIAEVGINHNGSFSKVKKLIKVAKQCGADFVKFQIFKAENVTTKYAKKSNYQKKNKGDTGSQYEMIKRYEFDYTFFKKIKIECKKNKINFLCSPFDIESLKYLKNLGEKIIKIPSGEITNYPLLREIGMMRKKVILSTGMSNLIEIKNALKTILNFGVKKKDIALLHCVTSYPAPFSSLNLKSINLLKKKFRIEVGFSDHSPGIEASIAAVALGARIIEKHLTISKKLIGPDHKSSLDPKEFELLVSSIRNVEKSLKFSKKKIQKCEVENIQIVRKSIVAKNIIKKGDLFNENNLTTKRPGSGINPMNWNKYIGKKSKKNYIEDELL